MSDDDKEEPGELSPVIPMFGRESGASPTDDHCGHLLEIEAHVEEHVGPIETVYHELVSDLIHLDILVVPATPDRRYQLLVTSGVSDLPMTTPEGAEEWRRAELLMALPPEWPLDHAALEDESNYWPVRWLKQVGRLPHECETWVGWGHTVPNGDPAEPIADTPFSGVMLVPPYWLPPEFFRLDIGGDEAISFFSLVPLHPSEMALKLKKGAEALEERFEAEDVDPVLDVGRQSVAKRRWWPW